MATQVNQALPLKGEPLMLQQIAVICLIVVIAGFGLNAVLGRVDYSAKGWMIYAHGLIYLGWCVIACVQPMLIGRANRSLHRKIGWFSCALALMMGVNGLWITYVGARDGVVQPGNLFMALNILTIAFFWAMIAWAVIKRRNMAWHGRLMACATILLTGPAWARLLPMEQLGPFGLIAISGAIILIGSWGMVYDKRQRGKIHPAWYWGLGSGASIGILGPMLAFSPPFANWVASF